MVLPPVVTVEKVVSVEIAEPVPDAAPAPPDGPPVAVKAVVAARVPTELPALEADEAALLQYEAAYDMIPLVSVPAGQDSLEQSRTP